MNSSENVAVATGSLEEYGILSNQDHKFPQSILNIQMTLSRQHLLFGVKRVIFHH